MATGDSFYEDEYLLSLLRQGSQDAFTQIYNKYYSMLYSLSCRYLQDRELAEDVVQQVYLRLWESRSSVCITASLKNYLYTMAKNHVLNMIRDKNEWIYNPQIQISAESETKRSIFREKDKTKRSKKESAQHSKSRNKSFVMTSVSAL